MSASNKNIITRYIGTIKTYKLDNYHLVIQCKNDMINISNFELLIYGYFKLSLFDINIPMDILQHIITHIDIKYFDYAKYYGWQPIYRNPKEFTLENDDISHIDIRSWELETIELYKNRSDFALFASQLNENIKEKVWKHITNNINSNNDRLNIDKLYKLISFIFLLKYKIDDNISPSIYIQNCIDKCCQYISNDIINSYSLQYIDKIDFIQFIGNWLTKVSFSKEWRQYLNNEDSMLEKEIRANYYENEFDFNMIYENASILCNVLKEKHRECLWNDNNENIKNDKDRIIDIVIKIIRLYIEFDKGIKTKPKFTPSIEYRVRKCGEWIYNNYGKLDKNEFIKNGAYFSKILNKYVQR